MKLILASASPRRKQILEKYGYEFEIIPSTEEEQKDYKLSPEVLCESIARQKGAFVRKLIGSGMIISADTIVCIDGKILGKPKSKEDAAYMLNLLSGRTHKVITAYYFDNTFDKVLSYCETAVTFNVLDEKTIAEYIKSGNCMDKAGSYGVQDGFDLVKSFDGSFYNVMGFPIDVVKDKIDEMLNRTL